MGKCTAMEIASSPESSEKEFKMGGIAILARGQFSSSIDESGTEKGGRWAWITIRGAKNQLLTVISTYQVCNNTSSGLTTIYNQQFRYLSDMGLVNPNPRNQFLTDLESFV